MIVARRDESAQKDQAMPQGALAVGAAFVARASACRLDTRVEGSASVRRRLAASRAARRGAPQQIAGETSGLSSRSNPRPPFHPNDGHSSL